MSKQDRMACERIERMLGAFVDGELNSRQAAAVEKHVGLCPSCARKLDDLRTLSSLVADAVADEPLPPTLRASVMRVVRTECPDRETPRRAPHWRRWGTALACSLCLVVVVLALIVGGGDKMMMEGIFDANTMAPDAPDAAYPPYDKSENANDSYYGGDHDADYDDPTSPEAPDEPMAPMEPSLPELPTTGEEQMRYMLHRQDGAATGVLDGEWIGETLRLTLVAQTGEAKVAYSGWSEARLAAYTVQDGVLTLTYEDGAVERFDFDCEEGVLWLTRK